MVYPAAHLLGIARELRNLIYAEMINNTHQYPRPWQWSLVSPYSGLLTVCKQLHQETSTTVFLSWIGERQILKLSDFPRTKSAFLQIRSLQLQMNHREHENLLIKFLDRFQLSLQELALNFVGPDGMGVETGHSACGSRVVDSSSLPALTLKGQQLKRKLRIFQRISILRNLRVLKINNANTPLLPSILVRNKPHLEAISINCDPRTVDYPFHILKRFRRQLQGLLIPVSRSQNMAPPPLRALELDAHSVFQASEIPWIVAPTLEHLSWRVADTPKISRDRVRLYTALIGVLSTTFSSTGPSPKTLRICIDCPKTFKIPMSPHIDTVFIRLSWMNSLRELEIHYSGKQDFGSMGHQLVRGLPRSLLHLYITDYSLTAQELHFQIQERMFLSWMSIEETQPILETNPQGDRPVRYSDMSAGCFDEDCNPSVCQVYKNAQIATLIRLVHCKLELQYRRVWNSIRTGYKDHISKDRQYLSATFFQR